MSDQPLQPQIQPEPKAEAPKPVSSPSVDQNRILAAISYFGILFLIPLLIVKNDEFVKFHVKQGIVWFAVWFIASFIMWLPLIGWSIGVVIFALSCYAGYQAYEGKRWELPYLAKYAQQIKL